MKRKKISSPLESFVQYCPLTWELRPTFSLRIEITLSLIKFTCLSFSTHKQFPIKIV